MMIIYQIEIQKSAELKFRNLPNWNSEIYQIEIQKSTRFYSNSSVLLEF